MLDTQEKLQFEYTKKLNEIKMIEQMMQQEQIPPASYGRKSNASCNSS